MSFWTNDQIIFLQQHLTFSPSERIHLYRDRFGNSRSTGAIERQVRRIRSANQILTNEPDEDKQDDLDDISIDIVSPQAQLLREVLGRSVRGRDIETKYKDRTDLDQFIDDLIERTKNVLFSPAVAARKGSSLCVLLSDTHIGKHTDSFNKEVFVERLLSISDKIQNELALPEDLEEIVLMLAGDMLEGEGIFETQAHSLEMPAIDQIQIAVDTIWSLALSLRETFGVPIRIVTCPGNHGRVSKQASEKTNWDNVIYQTLGYLVNMSGEPISMNVNFEAFTTFPVQDKVGMLFHHGTKHLGTPAMQSKVAGWIYTKQFDFMCHGHWHHWEVGAQFGKLVMKNGSLPGDDDLSERMGVFDPPRQGWLLVRNGQPINQVGFFEW